MTLQTTAAPQGSVAAHWTGEVTWRRTALLREELFDLLEQPQAQTVRLDVCAVTAIDTTGVALLIGANHRASGMGRRLVLVDRGGPVTQGLARIRLLDDFHVVQVLPV